MKQSDIRSLLATAVVALLTACGGSPAPEDAHTTTAALMVQNGPVADCEAEGCNRPRIIDGNAEQFRASAALQAQLAEQAAAPQYPAAQQQDAGAGEAPGATPPAAGGQPQ